MQSAMQQQWQQHCWASSPLHSCATSPASLRVLVDCLQHCWPHLVRQMHVDVWQCCTLHPARLPACSTLQRQQVAGTA